MYSTVCAGPFVCSVFVSPLHGITVCAHIQLDNSYGVHICIITILRFLEGEFLCAIHAVLKRLSQKLVLYTAHSASLEFMYELVCDQRVIKY